MKRGLQLLTIFVTMIFSSAYGADSAFVDADNEIARCDKVLRDISSMPDKYVPKELFQKARGLAIFPGVLNIGALLGIELGKGIILRRDQETLRWSNPAFFIFRSGSIGLQLGAQSIDLILLFMDEIGLQRLLEEKLILGADVSVSAGPLGRDTSVDTNLRLKSQILSYSKTKGLFAGLSINSGVIQPDRNTNEAFYGTDVSVQDVLYENKGTQTDNIRTLLETINSITR
ncbi:MAG: lipid-binding SYLF domain-containing protein [Deltaproteobacteria bacterium]|nr:lipid-binding SYLF domain-containing protein [Deltaproteobacteria bacterium]